MFTIFIIVLCALLLVMLGRTSYSTARTSRSMIKKRATGKTFMLALVVIFLYVCVVAFEQTSYLLHGVIIGLIIPAAVSGYCYRRGYLRKEKMKVKSENAIRRRMESFSNKELA